MRCRAVLLAHKMLLARGLLKHIAILSRGPSATPPWLQPSRRAECGAECSWLQQPHSRAGFEEGFQQALGGGNRPLGWEMENAAFVLSRMKMAAGSSQIPEASGQPLSSRWDVWGETGYRGVISSLPSCLGWDS